MEEAERLCDRLVIIDHGKVIADDTLLGPASAVCRPPIFSPSNSTTARTAFRSTACDRSPKCYSVEKTGGILKVGVRDLTTGTPPILQWLAEWPFVAACR